MPLHRASLGRYLPWTAVLPAVGVPLPTSALPITVRCPLCREPSLLVLEDNACGGQWYWCRACQFAGDAIELLAAAPGGPGSITAAAGLVHTLGSGLPDDRRGREDIAAYERDYIAARKRHLDFWHNCRVASDAHDNDAAAAVQRRFGIPSDRPSGDRWAARGGRLVGFSTRDAAEAMAHPADAAAGDLWGTRRLFRGRGWGPLVVVPFWDLPGRIVGFFFVGRAGEINDRVYHRVGPITGGADTCRNSGIAMLPAILGRNAGKETLVIVNDVEAAVALQLRHLIDHAQPLPVVATWESDKITSKHAWRGLPPHPFVFTSTSPIAAIDAARIVNGRVGTLSAGSEAATTKTHICRDARPWLAALETIITPMSPTEAQNAVTTLSLPPDELKRFIAGCGGSVGRNLSPLLETATHRRTIVADSKTIIATDQGWFVARTAGKEELVTDAPFQIDRVVSIGATGRAIYEGRVRLRNVESRFTAPSDEFDKDPFGWLTKHARSVGLGVTTSNTKFSPLALFIAQQFHRPTHVIGTNRVGWATDRAAFVLPRYSQEIDGTQTTATAFVGDDSPCRHFEVPDGLSEIELAAITNGTAAAGLFLAVLAHTVASVIAPAVGTMSRGLALVGRGAIVVGRNAATACGCREIVCTASGWSEPARVAEAAASQHDWPVSVVRDRVARDPQIPLHVAASLPRSVIVPVRDDQVALLSIIGGWDILVSNDDAGCAAVAAHTNRIMSHYLADLCHRRLALPDADSPVLAILDDLAAWLSRLGYTAESVSTAKRLLRLENHRTFVAAFTEIISRVVDTRASDLIREDVGGVARATSVVITRDDRLFIPEAAIRAVITSGRIPGLDRVAITSRLIAADVDAQECERDGHAGWTVPLAWWQTRRQSLTGHTRKLRIAAHE